MNEVKKYTCHIFGPKRWQVQRYDVGACDGVAASCNGKRKTSWKEGEKKKKNRECDSSDNIHIRDKILEYVTNWGWGAGAKKGDRESEKMDAFNKQKCKC